MSPEDPIDPGIWRETGVDVTHEQSKREALEASQGAIAELEEDGTEAEWVRTDVLEHPESDSECACCHHRAPGEEAIRERSKRAGLPVTKLTRTDDRLDTEAAE